jgi:hypothetical protein
MQSNQYMHENLISGLQQDEEKNLRKGKGCHGHRIHHKDLDGLYIKIRRKGIIRLLFVKKEDEIIKKRRTALSKKEEDEDEISRPRFRRKMRMRPRRTALSNSSTTYSIHPLFICLVEETDAILKNLLPLLIAFVVCLS